jgi:two-component system sensor histidine kinase KdpD
VPELAMPRGQHKVFLGMAVGVGKTFRMLQEAQVVSAEGRDVAIGLLETHGRPETAAVATGLELIPRRLVAVHGAVIEEMDLPAIVRRAPQVCLIDELAHTNAPGLEHDQRYEDVEDVLAAGISVFSTVNVQHLQSVSERIAEKTGIVIRTTMPDRVIDEADEVVVVDLTPEALQARIIDGKVFPAGSVPVALERFFTKDNLDVLPGRHVGRRDRRRRPKPRRRARGRPATDQRVVSRLCPQIKSRRTAARARPSGAAEGRHQRSRRSLTGQPRRCALWAETWGLQGRRRAIGPGQGRGV